VAGRCRPNMLKHVCPDSLPQLLQYHGSIRTMSLLPRGEFENHAVPGQHRARRKVTRKDLSEKLCQIQPVSGIQTGDNLGHAGWSENGQGLLPAGNPGVEIEIRQGGNMVRLKLSEEDRFQALDRQAPSVATCKEPAPASTRYDDSPARTATHAWARPRGRERRGSAAKKHLEPVDLVHRRRPAHCRGYRLFERPVLGRVPVPGPGRESERCLLQPG